MYTSIYSNENHVLLEQLSNTSEMRRLSDIGMHCGCEYAKFPFYKYATTPYSRLMHSIGVSKIIWNFTHDITQAIAGLFHDIATPVFAHTIDFLNGDHLTQESTEEKTFTFISKSKEISSLLKFYDIHVEDICDYHMYPIADSDIPMLSADRLEYTLGNGFCVHNMKLPSLNEIYRNLIVAENEYKVEELCFQSVDIARKFTEISLSNSNFFVSDESRFAMQYLADIVRFAVKVGALVPDDLYLTEREVVSKLNSDCRLSEMWNMYTNTSGVAVSVNKPVNQYSVNVPAKKRYIDPLVLVGNSAKRLSDVDNYIQNQIRAFLNVDLNKWIYAI